MKTPWEILDLDHDGTTEKDAKRAYAKLLKKHRPDQDPAGFQKIREAYESVIGQIKFGNYPEVIFQSADGEETTLDALALEIAKEKQDDFTAKSIERGIGMLPPELQSVRENIEIIEASDSLDEAEEHAALVSAYAEGQQFAHDNPNYLNVWGLTVVELFREHSEVVRKMFKNTDVVQELENDIRWQSDMLIDCLISGVECRAIEDLADHLIKSQKRLINPVAAMFLIEFAEAVGFFLSIKGNRLIDLAFPNLSPGERNFSAARVEERMAIGRIFRSTMVEDRVMFWYARLREADLGREFDWLSPAGMEEVEKLCSSRIIPNQFFDITEGIIPEDILDSIKERRAKFGSGFEENSGYQAVSDEPVEWGKPVFFLIVVAVLMVKCGIIFDNSNSSNDYRDGLLDDKVEHLLEEYQQLKNIQETERKWNPVSDMMNSMEHRLLSPTIDFARQKTIVKQLIEDQDPEQVLTLFEKIASSPIAEKRVKQMIKEALADSNWIINPPESVEDLAAFRTQILIILAKN